MSSAVLNIRENGTLTHQVARTLSRQHSMQFVELYVSDVCPLSCRHCFHADVRSIDPPLSSQEWELVVNQSIDLGVRHFHLAGREPFAADVTLSLLEHFANIRKGLDFTFGAITNGISCRPHLNAIKQSGLDYLEISVDGLADSHEFLRGRHTYTRVLSAVAAALAALGDDRLSTATTLYKGNVGHITEIIDVLGQLGVRRFFFQPLARMGYARWLGHVFIDGYQYRQAILQVREMLRARESHHPAIAVMFYVPPGMVRPVCVGNKWLEQSLMKCLSAGEATSVHGHSYLQLDFDIIRVPFWRNLIVTEDGYLLDHCSSRSTQAYIEASIGNIRRTPLVVLLQRCRARALEHVLTTRGLGLAGESGQARYPA